MKTLLITHKDLDGVVSAIVVKAALGDKVQKIYDISLADTYPTFRKVLNRLDRNPNLRLIVTDIATDGLEKFNSEIRRDIRDYVDRIWWIDHHPHNEVADAMKHKVYEVGRSASMLTYEVFSKKYDLTHLRKLVIYADDYDMWNLKYKMGWVLSDLYYHYWTEKFMGRFGTGNLKFTKEEKEYILKLEQRRKTAWVKVQRDVMVGENEYGKYYIIFVNKKEDINFLCEKLKRNNEDNCDFTVAVTGGKTISLRAINQELNFPELLGHLGVGGHPLASGVQVKDIEDMSHPFVKSFFREK